MDEDRIRQRAYAIWEQEGRPEGRHEAHWEQARQELMAEDEHGRAQAGIDAPVDFDANVLHPSGRNQGNLRPAAEAMGDMSGQGGGVQGGGTGGGVEDGMRGEVRGRTTRAPGAAEESGGGA